MVGSWPEKITRRHEESCFVILLIDNYDSFAHNLGRYFVRLGKTLKVVRNDQITVEQIRALQPTAIVLSPGPCTPNEAGVSLQVVQAFVRTIPILGVCLGHQTIAAALGGRIVKEKPVHGMSSQLSHDGQGIFSGLPQRFDVARYHSLAVEESTLPDQFEVSARTGQGVVMAIRHRQYPVVGIQFHPESILTEYGYEMLAGFLAVSRLDRPEAIPSRSSELTQPEPVELPATPQVPITF